MASACQPIKPAQGIPCAHSVMDREALTQSLSPEKRGGLAAAPATLGHSQTEVCATGMVEPVIRYGSGWPLSFTNTLNTEKRFGSNGTRLAWFVTRIEPVCLSKAIFAGLAQGSGSSAP